MKYLILQNPGHNRVYYNSADKLALAELKLCAGRLTADCENIEVAEIEGIRYLSIDTNIELPECDMLLLSQLSFVFAIFIQDKQEGKKCLFPIRKSDYEYLDSKISSLLKYAGKTNELFTKMMINVAMLSSDFNYSDKIQMLDPVAGRGTTLFEGAIYGFDSYGIELEPKSIHDTAIFFKKYLEVEKIKHTSATRQIHGNGKSDAVNIQEFKYANTKEEFKSDESSKHMGVVCGNSMDAFKFFKRDKFNIIVGDLPYGIFHGNSDSKKSASKTRNPSEFLNDCVPAWHKVLKPGGCVVVAWNSFLVSRTRLSTIFTENKFEVLSQPPFSEFEHMVDKSIKRDIIVARKV